MKKIRFLISIISIILGIFLLTPSLTGHAIASIPVEATSFIGMFFIMLGVIGLYSAFDEEYKGAEEEEDIESVYERARRSMTNKREGGIISAGDCSVINYGDWYGNQLIVFRRDNNGQHTDYVLKEDGKLHKGNIQLRETSHIRGTFIREPRLQASRLKRILEQEGYDFADE